MSGVPKDIRETENERVALGYGQDKLCDQQPTTLRGKDD